MKKLLSVLIGLIILLAIIGFILYLVRAPLTEKILSSKLGTTVYLKQIYFKFKPSRILVTDFKVKNPPGYQYPYGLEIQNITVEAPFRNYLKDIVVVNKIELDNIVLKIEIPKGKLNNWQMLLGFIGRPKPSAPQVDKTKTHYAVIKLLVFNNLTIQIRMPDGSIKEQTFQRLEYKDLQTNEGDIGKTIMQALIYQMLFDTQTLLNIPLDITKDTLKDVLAPTDGALDKLNPLNWGK